ncbi:hypothetical protein ANME2D_01384 [Candidatus Methanoperedens nitroreducens]|uniref:Uncharacterized protein n=1 Tax=Candidatus Methanoperedens nitratireducens TaxID=1392998 RepID=A0A062V9G5_9EURY|nr:hypothetical protein ANME2D_01384 [Candidatus Methanoperedens nitroreducens]
MFSLNSNIGFDFITRYIWLVDRAAYQHQFTNAGNIPSSIKISVQAKPTLNTVERVTFPVTLVDMSTVRAFLASVPGINHYNRFSSSLSLISQKLLNLIEAPVIQLSIKLNSFGSALNSYAVQILNSDHITGHSNNGLRDAVVNILNKPFLTSAYLPEFSLSRSCAFALEFRSKVCVLCSNVFDLTAIEKLIVRSNCNINYSPVYSDNSISRCLGGILANSNMQVKSVQLSVIAKCGGSNLPIKITPVVFRNRKSSFYPALSGCKSNSSLLKVDVADSLVIPDSRELFTFRKSLKLNTFERFTGNISYSLKDRTRKLWVLSANVVISSMVDSYLTASVVIKTILSNLVKDLIAKGHGLSEGFFAFIRHIQFKFNRSIHIHIHILKRIDVNILWSIILFGRRGTLPLLLKRESFRYPCAPRRVV